MLAVTTTTAHYIVIGFVLETIVVTLFLLRYLLRENKRQDEIVIPKRKVRNGKFQRGNHS